MPQTASPRARALQPEPSSRRETAADLLAALEHGDPITARCVVVVAHPDDETISLGSRLPLLRDLELVQVTDGAPLSMDDALHAGFPDRERYRLAREAEAADALAALGARPRRRQLGVRDQDAVHRLGDVVDALRPLLAGARAVLTHPYEGGHPDHDACACAVQLACAQLAAAGRAAPVRLEFASYHRRDGQRVSQDFWADPDRHPVEADLDAAQLAAKARAFAAFRSQAEVMAWFSPAVERFRLAPDYDFLRPPPPGEALYDGFGWSFTSADWRRRAAEAMAALGVRS